MLCLLSITCFYGTLYMVSECFAIPLWEEILSPLDRGELRYKETKWFTLSHTKSLMEHRSPKSRASALTRAPNFLSSLIVNAATVSAWFSVLDWGLNLVKIQVTKNYCIDLLCRWPTHGSTYVKRVIEWVILIPTVMHWHPLPNLDEFVVQTAVNDLYSR